MQMLKTIEQVAKSAPRARGSAFLMPVVSRLRDSSMASALMIYCAPFATRRHKDTRDMSQLLPCPYGCKRALGLRAHDETTRRSRCRREAGQGR